MYVGLYLHIDTPETFIGHTGLSGTRNKF